MVSFTDLYFGMAESENEARDRPEEFVQSFVDHGDAVDLILGGTKFLLLGPKGAGKSAIAWYLELTSAERNQIVSARDISELPISDVERLRTGENPGPGRTVTAWRLLLSCAILDLMLHDQSSSLQRDPEVIRVTNTLRDYGFLDPTPRRAVLDASKRTIKVPIPYLGEVYTRERGSTLELYNLVPILEKWVIECETANSYLLALDGLDSIHLTAPEYSGVLAALVQAANLLHQKLSGARSDVRMVLLMRYDIFSRLKLPDASEIREDRGIHMDWRVLSGRPAISPLFELVNRKSTSLVGMGNLDVVSTFLPKHIELGGRRGGEPTFVDIYRYLLDLTRHTPRDLLRLLDYFQQAARQTSDPWRGKLTQAVIREGVINYASKYFAGAIHSELGPVSPIMDGG